jgi:two-component system, OmpR family, phosphate regulon sensor histidine kinase PhoR
MKFNRTTYVIGASTLALIALFVLQAKWMSDSRNLIEQQFDQKVRMALCFAVESLNGTKINCDPGTDSCLPVEETANGYQLSTPLDYELEVIDSTIAKAVAFYDIQMEYEITIIDKTCVPMGSFPQYCAALSPIKQQNDHFLSISFPGKSEFINGKLKFMFFSSIVILCFITLVFVFANYSLLKQKKIDEINRNLFNNMAHEFRTPLTNIGLATRMFSRKHDDLKDNKYLDVISKESNRLKYQVERVLHLAKLENGTYQLEKEKLQIVDLLKEVINDMDLRIREKQAKVNLEIKTKELFVLGDKFHLGNAFRNLLDNALKYSKNTALIDISVENSKDGILIHFQDNGIGISEKEQAIVFKKYKRSEVFGKSNRNGFGLGLAYVKMIVEQHRGFINVISELNKGCRFDLFLPAS